MPAAAFFSGIISSAIMRRSFSLMSEAHYACKSHVLVDGALKVPLPYQYKIKDMQGYQFESADFSDQPFYYSARFKNSSIQSNSFHDSSSIQD
jgi:hypothetical protein